jgi:predicted peptidase
MRRLAPVSQRLDDLPTRIEQLDLLVGDRSVTYGILSPKTSAPPEGRPLIVALHYGTATEPGLSPYVGLGFAGMLVLPAFEELGAVIVAPDAPEASWAHPASEEAVLAVIEAARKTHAVDARRTLVTGFSMGGQGTWFFAARHPEQFKAAIPMAAQPLVRHVRTVADVRAQHAELAGSTEWADGLTRTPLYVVASRADTSVPFDAVEHAAKAVEARGGRVRFAPVDSVPHHMVTGFVDPLREALPWLRDVWGA